MKFTLILSFDNLCGVYAELLDVQVGDGRESWTVRLGGIFLPDMKPIPGWKSRIRMLAPGTELVLKFYAAKRALEMLIFAGYADLNFSAEIEPTTESLSSPEDCAYFRAHQGGKNSVSLADYMGFLGPFPKEAANQLKPFLTVYERENHPPNE